MDLEIVTTPCHLRGIRFGTRLRNMPFLSWIRLFYGVIANSDRIVRIPIQFVYAVPRSLHHVVM